MKKSETHKNVIKDVTKIADGIIYRYILYSSRSKKVASFEIPLYSIEVIMTRDGEVSKNSLDEVFADIGKALSFFEKAAEYLATPIDLPYIFEDRIAF